MRTKIPDKLQEIIVEMDRRGSVNLTKLTVLKRWFEVPSHLLSFAMFIADQASRRKTKTTKQALELRQEARNLLADVDIFDPKIPPEAAARLHESLRSFQNRQRNVPFGAVRVINDLNLYLIECGLHIYLKQGGSPSEGYHLAASYCENYDPRYGNGLNGPSRKRIREIIDFIHRVETPGEAGA